MQIGLNLLYCLPDEPGGTETYARALVGAMRTARPSHRYTAFVSYLCRDLIETLQTIGVECVACPVDSRSRGQRYAWEQLVLPAWVANARVDLLHSLGYVAPLKVGVPSVVTIHDLNFFERGVAMNVGRRLALGAFVGAAAWLADHVITVSEFSKQQILHRLKVGSGRVSVIYHGGPRSAESRPSLRRSFVPDATLPRPYILGMAGAGGAHKNIARLINAYASAGIDSHELLIVGKPNSQALAEAQKTGAPVRFLGVLKRDEVLHVLSRADLFVMPSLYEGFGLPVLEAQTAGIPVACSHAGSLPEIAGPGALLFDPLDLSSMRAAIEAALRDGATRARLIRDGRHNLTRFSWAEAAAQTLATYGRLCGIRDTSPCSSKEASFESF